MSLEASHVKVTWEEGVTWIAFGPDGALPVSFTAEVDAPSLPCWVELVIAVRRGRPELDSFTLTRRRFGDGRVDPPITTERVRSLSPARLVRLCLEAATKPRKETLEPGIFTVPASGDAPEVAYGGRSVASGRGKRLTDDLLRQVAAVYRSAVADGNPAPTEAVRAELHAYRSTAGRWVMEARRRGFLEQATSRSTSKTQGRSEG